MTEYKIDISRSVRDIIDFYLELGGDSYEIEEGCLGWGITVLTGIAEKSYKITEYYQNSGTSGHTLERITEDETDSLIQKMYDRWADEEEEEEEENDW